MHIQIKNDMDLEKFIDLMLNHPGNISIEYTNMDGKESLRINGKDFTEKEEEFDDSEIKEKISLYKKKLETLDDDTFSNVIERAEKENMNLSEMNKGLELESYTEEDARYANDTIDVTTNLIKEVLSDKIEKLIQIYHNF